MPRAYLVEFADADGVTQALVTIAEKTSKSSGVRIPVTSLRNQQPATACVRFLFGERQHEQRIPAMFAARSRHTGGAMLEPRLAPPAASGHVAGGCGIRLGNSAASSSRLAVPVLFIAL